MEIGLLIRKRHETDIKFYGTLKTIKHTITDFELYANPRKTADKPNQPDYVIYLPSEHGSPILIGAAWHREFSRDGVPGEMISLTFDDPSFDAPLHVTAFRGDDENRWPITWRRERSKAA
jgi:uncharacterized protein (DUF736 family)